MWQNIATDKFLKTLEHLEYGSLSVITPDGKQYDFTGNQPGRHGHMHIIDWRTIPAFAVKGDIGLTEAYRDGWWQTDNLTDLLYVGLHNEKALESYLYGSLFSRLATRIMYFFTMQNTLHGSRKNIQAHYDLGNDFYQLWLDPSMSYSSALYHANHETLQQAQHNKYQRIIDRLETGSGNLLEVGCGWGGFAEQAIQNGDFAVKGITLSDQQHDYANKRLSGNAQIALEDYRHQQGKYDHIVSIEMFEAVGEKFWPTYFEKMKSLLKDKGKAVVQTITVDEQFFERYRSGGDMIRTFIFPGGMLPSETAFNYHAEKAGLRVGDTYKFGQDYGKTLKIWLDNFESKLEQVKALGFDEKFIRIWRFYLAACTASFMVDRTDVMQVELVHA